MKLIFFPQFRREFSTNQIYELDELRAILSHNEFNKQRQTVLYVHGYVEAPSHQSIHVIVDAYLKRGDHNILVLDWSELADGNFFMDAVPNMKQVSAATPSSLRSIFIPLPQLFLPGRCKNGRSHIEIGGRRYGY